jgi:hypothetical protein
VSLWAWPLLLLLKKVVSQKVVVKKVVVVVKKGESWRWTGRQCGSGRQWCLVVCSSRIGVPAKFKFGQIIFYFIGQNFELMKRRQQLQVSNSTTTHGTGTKLSTF